MTKQTDIFILYASDRSGIIEFLVDEIAQTTPLCVGSSCFTNWNKQQDHQDLFINKCRQRFATAKSIIILGSPAFFKMEVLVQLAKEAFDTGRSVFITTEPVKKSYPDWFRKHAQNIGAVEALGVEKVKHFLRNHSIVFVD